jgi:hypothetical protein
MLESSELPTLKRKAVLKAWRAFKESSLILSKIGPL